MKKHFVRFEFPAVIKTQIGELKPGNYDVHKSFEGFPYLPDIAGRIDLFGISDTDEDFVVTHEPWLIENESSFTWNICLGPDESDEHIVLSKRNVDTLKLAGWNFSIV